MSPRNAGWIILKTEPTMQKSKRFKVVAKSRRQEEFEAELQRQLQPERLVPLVKAALQKHRPEAQRIFGENWRAEHAKLKKHEPGEVGRDLGGEHVGLLVETREGEKRVGGGQLVEKADEKRATFSDIVHKQRTWNLTKYD